MSVCRSLVAAVLVLGCSWSLGRLPMVAAGGPGWTLLSVGGEEARIFRDDFGVPHVFAPTNRSLFQMVYFLFLIFINTFPVIIHHEQVIVRLRITQLSSSRIIFECFIVVPSIVVCRTQFV